MEAAVRRTLAPGEENDAILTAVVLGYRALLEMGDDHEANVPLFQAANDAIDHARDVVKNEALRYHLANYATTLNVAGMDGGGIEVSLFLKMQVFMDDLINER